MTTLLTVRIAPYTAGSHAVAVETYDGREVLTLVQPHSANDVLTAMTTLRVDEREPCGKGLYHPAMPFTRMTRPLNHAAFPKLMEGVRNIEWRINPGSTAASPASGATT